MVSLKKAVGDLEDVSEVKGVSVVEVMDAEQGLFLAKEILDKICNQNTLLILSGGSTPKKLYEQIAQAGINIGAAAMVDERYVEKGSLQSNETMIGGTGLLDYFQKEAIAFHGVLNGKERGENAKDYEKILQKLFDMYKIRVAILGIGKDGHTCGIAPNRADFMDPIFGEDQKDLLVSEFKDSKSMIDGGFGERVTITFKALEQMDYLIILAFGGDKKEALEEMFEKGPIEEIPARFYVRPDIAAKTILITDQHLEISK